MTTWIWIFTVFENHKKVSFEIASEASYFYILSEQKLTKNAKIGPSSQFLSTYTKKSLMT